MFVLFSILKTVLFSLITFLSNKKHEQNEHKNCIKWHAFYAKIKNKKQKYVTHSSNVKCILLNCLQGIEDSDKYVSNGGKVGKSTGNHYSVRIIKSVLWCLFDWFFFSSHPLSYNDSVYFGLSWVFFIMLWRRSKNKESVWTKTVVSPAL